MPAGSEGYMFRTLKTFKFYKMKHTFFKSLLLLSAGVYMLAGSSCKKLEEFDDTNVNPNGSLTPIPSALLTNAEIALGGVISGTGTGGTKAGIFAQYISETQYTDASLYAEPTLNMGGTYSGPMNDLQVIINKNTDPATSGSSLVQGSGSNANQIATATILKAYYVWTVTDRWGDVPYTEALQGAANLTPAYDKQSDIYAQILQDLKDGIAGFDGGLAMQGDIMYGGDQSKWKKLANTLRMQIALRMSKVYPNAGQFAATEFAAAYNDAAGYIGSNADNFTLDYPGSSFKNPYFTIYDGRTDYAFSQTIGDIMSNMVDGRKPFFKGSGSDFPYGLERADAINFGTGYAKFLDDAHREENANIVIVSAATSLLTVAEGMERGWITAAGTATIYSQAIAESFAQWGALGAAAYAAGTAANYTTGVGGGSNIGSNIYGSIVGADAITTTPLQRIQLQRYLAEYPNGVQGWSEWRRTGVPNLKPTTFATNSDAGKTIPRRYTYFTTTDYGLNPAQLAIAIARLTGGDKMNSRIWWDVQ